MIVDIEVVAGIFSQQTFYRLARISRLLLGNLQDFSRVMSSSTQPSAQEF